MELRKTITLADLLTYLGLNYEGVEAAVIDAASNASTGREFINNFHKYYNELGLGGDDKWIDCCLFLPIILKGSRLWSC